MLLFILRLLKEPSPTVALKSQPKPTRDRQGVFQSTEVSLPQSRVTGKVESAVGLLSVLVGVCCD